MRRDDNALLVDIAHAARLVGEFIAGKDRDAFLDDDKTQSAVLLSSAISLSVIFPVSQGKFIGYTSGLKRT